MKFSIFLGVSGRLRSDFIVPYVTAYLGYSSTAIPLGLKTSSSRMFCMVPRGRLGSSRTQAVSSPVTAVSKLSAEA